LTYFEREYVMTKYLIVNSDDFGISENVNRGIIEAYQKGIVNSTSVMANMPAAASGIRDAHQHAPQLGLGLHLVLSFGKPVAPPEKVPSLITEAGTFVSNYRELMAKIVSFTAQDLEIEFNAQFDHFVKLAGHKPDHLDSHHHAAYLHPAAFEVMMTLAEKHDLPYRRPSWLDGEVYADLPTNTDGKLVEKSLAIAAKHGNPRCPDYMVGIFFWDRRSRVEPFRQAIQALNAGYTELACHVGYGADLEEDFNIQRDDDLAAVIDPSIVALVKNSPYIQLVTFADLPK
jgi:chitin disaccharide deacetylase